MKCIYDSRDEGREVEKGGNAVELAELLIQFDHLLRMGFRIVRLLPILLLFKRGASNQNKSLGILKDGLLRA